MSDSLVITIFPSPSHNAPRELGMVMYHRWDIDLGTDLHSSLLCLVVAFCDVFHMLHHEFLLMRVKC